MTGLVIPIEAALLGALAFGALCLYPGVRAGRWSAWCEKWPPDDLA